MFANVSIYSKYDEAKFVNDNFIPLYYMYL